MLTYDFQPTFADRADWTLPRALRHRAGTHGDKVFLDVPDSGEAFTYAEVLDVATRIGSALLARGHEQGDRLVIMMPNRSEYVLAWLGAAMAGIAEVPINTAYRATFLEHQVSTVAPTGVVVSAELARCFVDSAGACGTVRRFYVVGDEPGEVGAALEALRGAGFEAEEFSALRAGDVGELPVVRPHDLAAVFFTSGTTGLSKGVMMAHAHMFLFADEGRSLTRLTDEDTYLSVGPLFHGNAQFLAAYPSMIVGARFVLRPRFSASRWLDWVRESRATVTNLVGVMSDFVWKQAATDHDADNDLRCVYAVPTPTTLVEAWQKRFGPSTFVENFGSTEASMPILTPYGVERPPGAAGVLVQDWFDVRLVDPETDEEVPVGQVGEMVVRAKQPWTTTTGYFGMPDRTAEAMRNCWFHTGDGLRRDEQGWYYFVDRLKDALRRRGENISSYEVEQALLRHPGVAECAVVAVPADEEAGEDEVMAYVVPAPGAALAPEELWEFADEALPYFAVPRYLRVIDALPKTPSEKVQKVELRRRGVDELTADRTKAGEP